MDMCTRFFTKKLNVCINVLGPECILTNVLIIKAASQTCLTRSLMQIVGFRLPVVTKQ